jgi:hypothetical protein
MNFLLLFSLVFTGFLVNVNSIPGQPACQTVGEGLPAALCAITNESCRRTHAHMPSGDLKQSPLSSHSHCPAAWIRWVHYLSVFYYSFEAMITSELTGLVFTFQASGSASIPNVLGEVFLETLGEWGRGGERWRDAFRGGCAVLHNAP